MAKWGFDENVSKVRPRLRLGQSSSAPAPGAPDATSEQRPDAPSASGQPPAGQAPAVDSPSIPAEANATQPGELRRRSLLRDLMTVSDEVVAAEAAKAAGIHIEEHADIIATPTADTTADTKHIPSPIDMAQSESIHAAPTISISDDAAVLASSPIVESPVTDLPREKSIVETSNVDLWIASDPAHAPPAFDVVDAGDASPVLTADELAILGAMEQPAPSTDDVAPELIAESSPAPSFESMAITAPDPEPSLPIEGIDTSPEAIDLISDHIPMVDDGPPHEPASPLEQVVRLQEMFAAEAPAASDDMFAPLDEQQTSIPLVDPYAVVTEAEAAPFSADPALHDQADVLRMAFGQLRAPPEPTFVAAAMTSPLPPLEAAVPSPAVPHPAVPHPAGPPAPEPVVSPAVPPAPAAPSPMAPPASVEETARASALPDADTSARRAALKRRAAGLGALPPPLEDSRLPDDLDPLAELDALESAAELAAELERALGAAAEANEQLRRDLATALDDLARSTAEGRRLTEKTDRLEAEARDRSRVVQDLLGELELLEGERDAALGQASEAALGSEQLQEQLLLGERRQHELERHLSDAQARIKRHEEAAAAHMAQRAALRAELDALRRERDGLLGRTAELERERDDLGRSRRALDEVHRALSEARARAQRIRPR